MCGVSMDASFNGNSAVPMTPSVVIFDLGGQRYHHLLTARPYQPALTLLHETVHTDLCIRREERKLSSSHGGGPLYCSCSDIIRIIFSLRMSLSLVG